MEIDGRITLMIGKDGLGIEIHDRTSGRTFFRGEMSAEQMGAAFGRLGRCEMVKSEVFDLDKVGLKLEMEKLTFAMPEDAGYGDSRKEVV